MRQRASSITALSALALTAVTVATPAFPYDVSAVSGGGSIEGQVIYKGPVQTRKIIPNKDVEVCGGIREEALIEVGPNQEVQNAAVYLVEVAKGKAWPQAGKPPELDNIKCDFVPDVQVIPAGTLNVVNKDPVLHNSHGYYGNRSAFNMALAQSGAINSRGTDARRHRTCRLRRAWLDGGLGLRGGQSLLRAHRP